MTYTDARGAFLISDVCVENASLSFVKEGFHTAQNWYQVSTGGLIPQIELIQNGKFTFKMLRMRKIIILSLFFVAYICW